MATLSILRFLLLLSDNGYAAQPAVYRVNLGDHRIEKLADLSDFRRVVIPWNP